MRRVIPSTQYKKDFKKIRHDLARVAEVFEVVRLLERGEDLPPRYNAHKLTDNYRGCLECHIESDFLLVWIDESQQVVRLLRLGSHSEIF